MRMLQLPVQLVLQGKLKELEGRGGGGGGGRERDDIACTAISVAYVPSSGICTVIPSVHGPTATVSAATRHE